MGSLSKLVLLSLASCRIWAGTLTVTDLFNVPGNSDVVGNKLQFDAQSIQITTNAGTLIIDIFTNYDNPNLYSVRDTGARLNPGDVFFTVNGAYTYGIPLALHNGPAGGPWGNRLLAGHVYQIDDPSKALMTARQVLHDAMYVEYRPDEIVWMFDNGGVHDVTAGTPSVQVLPIPDSDGENGPLYDIRVTTSLPAGLFSSLTDTYGVSFAVTTGGNDMVKGTLNFTDSAEQSVEAGAAVPEPGTWYLVIGAALVGLARMAWHRR